MTQPLSEAPVRDPLQYPSEPRRRRAIAGVVAGGLYFLLACFMMPDYGLTWDVSKGSYPYGDEIIAWWGSDTADFVEVAKRDEPPDVRQPYPAFHAEKQFPWYEVYPVGATLSALSSRVLWHWLGWVPPIAAHQIVVPLLTAFLIFAMVWFLGVGPGLSAVALMIASPRFLSHSMNNVKDAPECVFYVLALFGAYLSLTRRGMRHWILTGVALALALAQKGNALFIPFHVLVFFLLALLLRPRSVGIRWTGCLVGAAVFAGFYLAISPAFWHDTIARIGKQFGHLMDMGGQALDASIAPDGEPWMKSYSTPLHAVLTTPPTVLVLAVIGLLRSDAPRLLKLFLTVVAAFPIARLLVPGVRDFDGIRHFLEFYPGLCGLAGLGLIVVMKGLSRLGTARWPAAPRALWPTIGFGVCLASGVLAVADTYPFGTCYYNAAVGGLRGARNAGVPHATDYWGNSYWQGMEWINEHAAVGSAVYVPIAEHIVRIAAPVKLRDDIRVQPKDLAECEGDVFVMFITRRAWYDALIFHLEKQPPVHEIEVQGAAILQIHRLESFGQKAELFALLDEEKRLMRLRVGFFTWINSQAENPGNYRKVLRTDIRHGRSAAASELCKVLPQLSAADAAEVIRWTWTHLR